MAKSTSPKLKILPKKGKHTLVKSSLRKNPEVPLSSKRKFKFFSTLKETSIVSVSPRPTMYIPSMTEESSSQT
jgi:hypothetical protein